MSGTTPSNLRRSTPRRRLQRFPPLCLKRTPQLLCGVFPQITALFQQWWSVRHLPPTIQEHLWIADPGALVAVETPDPVVVGVNQPSLLHSSFVRWFISSSHGSPGQVKEQNLKKRVFQKVRGSEQGATEHLQGSFHWDLTVPKRPFG